MKYGEVAYYRYMLCRANLAANLLNAGITMWLVEADATWLRDPSPLVLSKPGDVVAMNDARPDRHTKEIQGGFQLLRPTCHGQCQW